ncbi:MAG: hypothetical protein SGPRY_001438 [Prymnesium sp.]
MFLGAREGVRVKVAAMNGPTALSIGENPLLLRVGRESHIPVEKWSDHLPIALQGAGVAELWFSCYRSCEDVLKEEANLGVRDTAIYFEVCAAVVAQRLSERQEESSGIIVIVASVCGVVTALFCLRLLRVGYVFYVDAKEQTRLIVEEQRNQIHDAVDAITSMRFAVCFVQFTKFRQLGAMLSHERCRALGILTTLDTYDDLLEFAAMHMTVFCSHQWLGVEEPDPGGVHYPAIVDACAALCASRHIPEEDLFIWLDYSSIPQANNFMKQASIDSLAVYSSTCHFFICIVPETVNFDSKKCSNAETYSRRGWVSHTYPKQFKSAEHDP